MKYYDHIVIVMAYGALGYNFGVVLPLLSRRARKYVSLLAIVIVHDIIAFVVSTTPSLPLPPSSFPKCH